MSMFPPVRPSSFQFNKRIVELTIERIRRDRQSSSISRPRAAKQAQILAWYREALGWLGCQLTSWGARLQERSSGDGVGCEPQPTEPSAA
jgi:hypothetical protein